MSLSNTNINMVFNTVGGKISAGGFDVNSELLLNRKPVVGEILFGGGGGGDAKKGNNISDSRNKVSARLNNLAVPAGICAIHQKYTNILPAASTSTSFEESATIEEDLYDRLLKMASPDYKHNFSSNNKKITRKREAVKKNKKTRRK
jgi:hypothetical protein